MSHYHQSLSPKIAHPLKIVTMKDVAIGGRNRDVHSGNCQASSIAIFPYFIGIFAGDLREAEGNVEENVGVRGGWFYGDLQKDVGFGN